MSDYTAKLTVQKWEKDLKVKLDKLIEVGAFTKAKCVLYMKHVDSIKNLKNFSHIWINGSNSVKDSIQKHLNGKAYKKANDLQQRKTIHGAELNDKVVKSTLVGRGLSKMAEKDLETLRIVLILRITWLDKNGLSVITQI